jgi:hypothetical protein
MFQLRISTLIWRWYFMMVVGILAVYTSQAWLIVLTMLVAVSAVLGYRLGVPAERKEGKLIRMEEDSSPQRRKAG